MKIGLLYSRSGACGIWVPAKDAAATVAAAEINAGGGILGKDAELVIADCGSCNSQAIEAVDTLVKVEGVDVIIGVHPSGIRYTISNRLAGQVAYVYTSQYEGVLCGPSTLAIGPQDEDFLTPALRWLHQEKGMERFYFVGNDYIWPHMAFDTTWKLVAEQGAQVVGASILPLQVPDYTELMAKIARSGAQVVVQALVGQAAVEFNRAFAAAGLDERILRFGLITDETIICATGADASRNLFTAARFFASHRSRTNDLFLETYHGMFGEYAPPISSVSLACYQGVHFVAELARTLGTRNRRDLARHLRRPMEKRSTYSLLDGKPGVAPEVYMASADGVRLEVVAKLTR
ncbi:urea transport system substrate-binding protein [Bradyrhizobium sp. AZCC 2262]|uniref:substrate-binding domain-containing protein n=1 Tax=Bradyrhizobium sp. AZCC 2262 TaxID=3117022 RepID=UPI002FF3908E